ncbi:MAG: DUF4369 domain-containing protein [Flavobacteriaceae bacterium]|nr:DUF4369 domain-containing protein [Flavobacteriaceae bacterium]
MKRIFITVITFSLLFSCSSEKENQMTVKGTIDGLRKGTVYLQKIQDSLLISVDSTHLNGVNTFELKTIVESPEIFYLSINNTTEKIQFFGEKGSFIINSRLDRFGTAFKVSGGKNQQYLEEHQAMIRKFNDRQLELIERNFKAAKAKNPLLAAKVQKEYNDLLRRRYLFTTNFAVQHADYEIAPFLALTQLNNAHIKLLDTINNSMSDKVKQSKYGLQLNKFVEKIKKEE